MPSYFTADKECPVPSPLRENIYYIMFIALLLFMTFMCRFIFAPLMPTIEKDLAISHAEAGSLFLFISVGMLISQIFSGHVSSRINHRGALFISTLGLGVPLILLNFSSSLSVIKALMFVLGFAAGLHMPSAIATMTAMVDQKDWGKAFGLHGLAPALSLTIGPFVAILLLRVFSWQTIIIMIGIFSIIVSFAFLRYCPCGEFPGAPPSPNIVKIVLVIPSFWIMVILSALFLAGNIGIYSMLSLYLIGEAGFQADLANSLLGLSRLSGLFTTFLSGMMVDRIGEKKHMILVMIAGGIATILIGTSSGVFLMIMLFLQPAIIGCFPTAGFSAMARIVQPNLRSVTTGFSTPISYLIGGGLGPVLLGYMGERYSFRTGIIVVGCLIILSTILVPFLRLIDQLEDGC